MSKVIVGLSTSIDGIAGGTGEHDFMAVHEAVLGWVFNLRSWRAAQGIEGGEDTAESKLWGEESERIGAQLTGRRMFDFSEPYWGDNPPFHVPVFVVTHRPAQRIEKQGGTSYTFVTGGVGVAIDRAREAAEGRDVLIAGGLSVAQQALAAGLVDEISLHIAPVLMGSGARLFDNVGAAPIRLTQLGELQGDGAAHLRYRVDRG
jgi:dihydrofolate reductase